MNPAQVIQKLRLVIRRQHKALATEETYVLWLRRYLASVRQMPNPLPSEQKLEQFLTELAHQGVAASTQQQAFNAITFFYKDVLGVPLQAVEALRVRRPEDFGNALPASCWESRSHQRPTDAIICSPKPKENMSNLHRLLITLRFSFNKA